MIGDGSGLPITHTGEGSQLGVPLIQGKTKDELYEWPAKPSTLQSFFASSNPKITLPVWHYRLGHPSASILKTVVSNFSLPC
ncbi:unnamed protein product, partial [Brassica rapa subsp. trilocularis]